MSHIGNSHLKKIALISAACALLVLAGWWLLLRERAPILPGAQAPGGVVQVMYTPEGFSPKEISIKQGVTVTFLDRDGGGMWVASDDHPEHAGYAGTPKEKHCPDASGLSFDQCSKGIMYSFTFQKTGIWKYHNHVHPEAGGAITVTQ